MFDSCMRLVVAIVLLLGVGCAPKQRIPLEVAPRPVTVFLDGEALEAVPEELVLRSDEPHVLFFKSEGYRPQRVVLESVEVDGASRLEPETVRITLLPVARAGRELVIEPSESPSAD